MGFQERMMRMMMGMKSPEATQKMMSDMMPEMMGNMGPGDMQQMIQEKMPAMMDSCFAGMDRERREFLLSHCRAMLDRIEEKYLGPVDA